MRRTLALAALIVTGILLAGCGRAREASADAARADAAAAGKPNVLIVVLDAMRADHVGAYGYQRNTTPAIDALASDPDAVVFHQHFVQGAYTKSSTASLFTGLYVFQHGVLLGHRVAESAGKPGHFSTQVLRDELDTMAEAIAGAGYATFGIVKSDYLDARYGFAQGFEEYYEASVVRSDRERVYKTAELAAAGGRPFFGYLHLAACHHPFPPPSRHPEIMRVYGYEAGLKYDELKRIGAGVDFTTAAVKDEVNAGRLELEPADVAFLNLVYDAELRSSDVHAGALFAALRAADLWDDTLLIVTADHGEELYDHGGYAHGHALWDEVIRVPLIVKFPRGSKPGALPRHVHELTQAVDLMPALLEFAGVEAPAGLPGGSIFQEAPRGFAFSETDREWAIVHDGYKLIGGGDRTQLFARTADPGEHENLAAAEPQRVEALRQKVEALRQHISIPGGAAPIIEAELSEEAVRALRSLGYMQ